MADEGLCLHEESAFGHLMNSYYVIRHCSALLLSNIVYPSGVILPMNASERPSPSSPISGLLHSSPDSLAESWFRAKLSRQRSYSSAFSYEESELDLSRSLGIHALIDNMVSFISGDVGLAPAFKEPEESMSTSPQATILAMEQQQSRAEVRECLKITFILAVDQKYTD